MENKENQSVKDRIIEFVMFKNISVRAFENTIGVANGYFSHLKAAPKTKIIQQILEEFPELDRIWLLTGEGEMLRGQVQNVSGHHNTATMNGDITHNYAPGTDLNLALMNEITEHRKIINKSQEQIDELIGIIKELAGKVRVES